MCPSGIKMCGASQGTSTGNEHKQTLGDVINRKPRTQLVLVEAATIADEK